MVGLIDEWILGGRAAATHQSINPFSPAVVAEQMKHPTSNWNHEGAIPSDITVAK